MARGTHPAFIFWIEVELWAMEGFDISLPCNQPQPDVIKPEHLERYFKISGQKLQKHEDHSYVFHLGVVGSEVHINESLSRKDISTSCYIRWPEVIGVLVQTDKPL